MRLYDLTGWIAPDQHFDRNSNFIQDYSLGFLVEKAFELGIIHVKIKQAPGGYIITAPPCYRVEGSTPANALAILLIRNLEKAKVLA